MVSWKKNKKLKQHKKKWLIIHKTHVNKNSSGTTLASLIASWVPECQIARFTLFIAIKQEHYERLQLLDNYRVTELCGVIKDMGFTEISPGFG